MKKYILFVLLSLVLTQQPQCQVYETYDQQTQKCVKVCEETEYLNETTYECEICNEGETYNNETKQCEKKRRKTR